jgi:hypothetical protein
VGSTSFSEDHQVKTIFSLALILAAILLLAVLGSVRPPLVASPILAGATV